MSERDEALRTGKADPEWLAWYRKKRAEYPPSLHLDDCELLDWTENHPACTCRGWQEIAALRAENAALRQLVRDAEWAAGGGEFDTQCPWCWEESTYAKHKPDCPARPFLKE